MQDMDKQLDNAARSIDSATKRLTTLDSVEQPTQEGTTTDFEQLAKERAERELYAAKYREQLANESDDEKTQDLQSDVEVSDEQGESDAEESTSEIENNVPTVEEPENEVEKDDTSSRISESDEQLTGTHDENETPAMILNIPGAVYHLPVAEDASVVEDASVATEPEIRSAELGSTDVDYIPPIDAIESDDEEAAALEAYDATSQGENQKQEVDFAPVCAESDVVDNLVKNTASRIDDEVKDLVHDEDEYVRFVSENEKKQEEKETNESSTEKDREDHILVLPVAVDTESYTVPVEHEHINAGVISSDEIIQVENNEEEEYARFLSENEEKPTGKWPPDSNASEDDRGLRLAPYTLDIDEEYPDPVDRDDRKVDSCSIDEIDFDSTDEEESEYVRFLAEHEKWQSDHSEKKKPDGAVEDVDAEDPESDISDSFSSIEKSLKLVNARMAYEIESLKVKHRMLSYTFSMDYFQKDNSKKKIKRSINDRMRKLAAAQKREQANSTRYYNAVQGKYAESAKRRRINSSKVESIIDRLEYALKERELIEDKLTTLYEEAISGYGAPKETKVAERTAKRAYRSQLGRAKRVARMHAPVELKEKIFSLMNERTTMLSTIEKNKYLLSKERYTGADKRSLKRQNKELKRAARQKEEDIYVFMKKADKHNTNHKSGINQAAWVIGTIVVLGLLGALYFFAKKWGII